MGLHLDASGFADFSEISGLVIRNVEIRNFAGDGIYLRTINNSQFNGLHMYGMGRQAISLISTGFNNLTFNKCKFELNTKGAFDIEDGQGTASSLIFNECIFLNEAIGIQVASFYRQQITDLEFNKCVFDGSYSWHIKIDENVSGLRIPNCTFLNNYRNCIVIDPSEIVTEDHVRHIISVEGQIQGCVFKEATGRIREWPRFGDNVNGLPIPPIHDLFALDSPIIWINGPQVQMTITDNFFRDSTNKIESCCCWRTMVLRLS